MDRTFSKKLPALALAGSIICGAFQTAAAAEGSFVSGTHAMPAPNGAYFVFPVNRESQNMGDRLVAYKQYCENYADGCLDIQRKADVIRITPQSWARLQTVFARVRDSMRIYEDFKKYALPGTKTASGNDTAPDVWTRGEDGQGDCEDYVLRWEKEMREAGLPSSALLKTFLQSSETETLTVNGKTHTFNQGHMVLTIRTDFGDFIADILKNEMYPLAQLDKKWSIELVESPRNMTHFYKADIVNPTSAAYAQVSDRFPAPRLAVAGGS